MTEQAAWQTTDTGPVRVFALPDGGRWLVTVRAVGAELQPLHRTEAEVRLDVVMPVQTEVPELATALALLGPVARFRNPDLWDALGTAIIRQVIRTAQAKKLYRAFSATYGEKVELPDGSPYAHFPATETVLTLSDDQFISIGMTFQRRALRAAAGAYLERR
jgi:DNA-3-methyladenine glycosylase II